MDVIKFKTIKNKITLFFIVSILLVFLGSLLLLNSFSDSLHQDLELLNKAFFNETNSFAINNVKQNELTLVSNLMDEKATRVNSELADLAKTVELISFSIESMGLNKALPGTSEQKTVSPRDFKNSEVYRRTLIRDPNFTVPISYDYPDFLLKNPKSKNLYNYVFWALTPIFKKFRKIYNHSLWSYLGFELDGSFFNYPGTFSEPGDYDPRSRPWYVKARKAKGKTVWVAPYFDSGQGSLVMTVSKAINYSDSNSLFGVVGTDILLDMFLSDLTSVNLAVKNIAFLVIDEKNQIIFRRGDESVLGNWKFKPEKSSLAGVVGQEVANEVATANFVDYKKISFGREPVYVYKRKLNPVNWTLVGLLKEADLRTIIADANYKLSSITESSVQKLYSNVNKNKMFYVITFSGGFFVSILILYFILNRILVAPINGMIELIKNFSSIDEDSVELSRALKRKDEIGEVVAEIYRLKITIREFQKQQIEQNEARIINQIASQVSHDIRSPLSALNMVVASIKELPEDRRLLIRNAAHRINDIANGLLRQSKQSNRESSDSGRGQDNQEIFNEPVMLGALIDAIISEKRIQFREQMGIEIQGDLSQGYGLFGTIDPADFSRMISNLVNNSVEAIHGSGWVSVGIRRNQDQIMIEVSDNGRGITPAILEKLGERGTSYGKDGLHSGSGLGLFHARQTIEGAGGHLLIQSQPDVGTKITLTLPRAKTPKWFVDKISLSSDMIVVSVDDDQTIHQIWAGRLASEAGDVAGITHLTFSSLELFELWASENKYRAALFLIDYEFLGQSRSGLDVIERTGIARRTVLVTSRYEEPHIRTRSESLGVKILPKSIAPFVPLEIEKSRPKHEATLIDDDSHAQMI